MKKWLPLLLPIGCVIAVAVLLAPGSKPTVSPYRTATIFVDAFDNADFRQVCALTYLHDGQTVAQCQQFYVGQTAQGLFAGYWGDYKIVGHSLRTWRQGYRGRMVELATVRFQYRPTKRGWGRPLTASLVKTHEGLWKVWLIR